MAEVAVLRERPVVDAERRLALDGRVGVGDRVQHPPAGELRGRLVAVDGGGDALLLQQQGQVQARYSGSDDGDSRRPAATSHGIRPFCVSPVQDLRLNLRSHTGTNRGAPVVELLVTETRISII